jgi:hypothetical protein
MINDLAGLGKIVESVCGTIDNISNNLKEWKVTKLNNEKDLKLALQNILPQILNLPNDEREFFITSIYPRLIQYSNYHAFSKDLKDNILLSYSKMHPGIARDNLAVRDENFKQLYSLVESHLTERRTNIKQLI